MTQLNDLDTTQTPNPALTTETPVVDLKLSFEDLNLHPTLVKEIQSIGWTQPTPVQQMCLPLTIAGRDVAGFAQTGTGKTGVFLITLANKILRERDSGEGSRQEGPIAVVLTPTRELAMQINGDAELLFKNLGIRSLAVFGGVDYDKQAQALKDGVDVVFATPGRLKDYYQKKILSLDSCEHFICDEADRMFDMGFIEDVEYFLDKLDDKIQKLLFSATTNEKVKELAFEYLENPEYISVNPEVITPENIEQHAVICESKYKLQVMLGLLKEHQPHCAIIFTNTKVVAEWLHYKLGHNGLDVDLITGDLPQRKRIQLIQRIKQGKIKALIATDVASRGLHISDLTHVYNFDLPDEASNYVHRIGRTARAGAHGKSYSLVCEDYGANLEPIQQLLGEQIKIPCEWFDNSYLSIKDQAGNPYKDPTFRGNSLPADEAAPRSREGKRPERERERGQQGGGQKKFDRPRQDKPSRPAQQHQHQQQQSGGRPRHPQRERDQNKPRHQAGGHKRPLPTAAAAAPAQQGFVATVKRFFNAMFGKR